MSTALVVLTENEFDDELQRAVTTYVTGTDVEVVLCRVIDEDEYRGGLQRKARAGEAAESIDEIEAEAENEAEQLGDRTFDETVSYTPLGLVGELPDVLLERAAERDYDHIFIAGQKRTPTGKVLFGDLTQSVILNFNGPVTVTVQD